MAPAIIWKIPLKMYLHLDCLDVVGVRSSIRIAPRQIPSQPPNQPENEGGEERNCRRTGGFEKHGLSASRFRLTGVRAFRSASLSAFAALTASRSGRIERHAFAVESFAYWQVPATNHAMSSAPVNTHQHAGSNSNPATGGKPCGGILFVEGSPPAQNSQQGQHPPSATLLFERSPLKRVC